LTGLAQVNGFRGNTSMTGRLAMDLEYVSRQGLGMYLATLAATISVELEQWTRR
jgi:lipopolysaccharide/colanic/teichoic acid biosynthesis glycosyltransferase